MATEVGIAYVTLIPSAKGFASKMQIELSGDIARGGTSAGTIYGDKLTTSAGSRMKSGASKMFSALKVAGPLAAVAAGAAIGKVLISSIGEAREWLDGSMGVGIEDLEVANDRAISELAEDMLDLAAIQVNPGDFQSRIE